MSLPPFSPFAPEDVLECARSIRPILPELLSTAAAPIDQELADLLAQARAGETVDRQILAVLQSHPKTQSWAGEFLSKSLVAKGDYQPLPGLSAGSQTVKYICPVGNDFTRRLRPGEAIPLCRTHNVPLVPATPSAD